MKTNIKVSHKKKVSKISKISKNKGNRFSRLKNKKRRQFKWKGTGGSKKNPNKQRGFTGLYVEPTGHSENENENENSENNQTMIQELNPNNKNQTGFKNIEPRKHTKIENSPVKKSIKKSQKNVITDLKLILPQGTFIEITDSFFQVQYKYIYKELNQDISELYYFVISLDKLSIDRLQYYINNSNITRASTDKSTLGNFLELNINTLVVKVLNTGGQYRTGSSNDFIDVYESVDESVEKNIVMISYEENIERMVIHNGFLINICFINDKDKDKHNILPIINKDISWLNSIYIDLNATNNLEGKKNIEYFLEQYKVNLITQKTNIFTCDDLNIDHTRLIFEEISNKEGEKYVIIGYPDKSMKPYIDLYNKNQNEFKKIYQDHKKNYMKYMAELHNNMNMQIGNNKIDMAQLQNEIHKFYGYDEYYKYIANFYENAFTLENKIKKNEEYPTNAEYGIPYDPYFQTKFKELQKAFYNELASKCLNKPMIKINYVFFIFKKHTEGKYKDMYVPAIFNFRQLTHKHHPILQILEKLIKSRLSKIYGIIEDETKEDYKLWYSHYNYGDIFHIKTEYVHTMSNIQQQAYKYKNSISLEELIYMLSIQDVNLINLRLDYQKKQGEFIKNDDDSKRSKSTKRNKNSHKLLSEQVNITRVDKCYNPDTELLKKDILIKLENFLNKSTKILLMFVETGNIYTIIYKNGIDNKFYKIKIQSNICSIYPTIIKNLYHTQKINKFENLIKEYKQFNKPNELHKTSPNLDLSKVYDIVGLELYKVLEHKSIYTEDYTNIRRYNPLLLRTIINVSNIPKDDKPINKSICIDIFFKTPLTPSLKLSSTDILIPNPFLKKPFIIRNFLGTNTYKEQYQHFENEIKNNSFSYIYPNSVSNTNTSIFECSKESLTDEQNGKYFESIILEKDNKRKFNRIFFNPGNCRYNFIEMCEKTKRVVWIVPLNATDNENIEEDTDNIKEFNNNVPVFLGNFANLTNNHIIMLEQLDKLFNNEKYESFFNIGSIFIDQFILHIHIFDKKLTQYSSPISKYQQGTRLNKFLNIKTVINLLKLGINTNKYEYYNDKDNKYNCESLFYY